MLRITVLETATEQRVDARRPLGRAVGRPVENKLEEQAPSPEWTRMHG